MKFKNIGSLIILRFFLMMALLTVALPSFSQTCNYCYGQPVTLTASPTGTFPFTYAWTCSDGTTGTTQIHTTDTINGNVSCIVDITDANDCSTSSSMNIVATIEPILVIQNNSCVISWQSQLLNGNICSGFILERSTNAGASWSTVANALPFTTSVSGLFRVKYTCDCGTFYSNELNITGCNECVPFEIADAGDCLWIISGIFPCNSEDYTLWQSINNSIVCGPTACNGASYTALYSNDDGFGFVNNDGCYYVTTSCGGVDYCSNVICINDGCDVGCSGAIAASQDDCNLDVTWALCTTNSYSLQYKSGSTWINHTIGVSSPPTTFVIPFDGIWRVVQSCTDGCTYNSAQFTFTGCGCNSNTSVVIFQQPNPCSSSTILAASISNCGSGFTPTYEWSTGATTNQITVGSGTYSVTVSDCCQTTNSSKVVVCDNPCGTYDVQIAGAVTVCNNSTIILTANVFDGLAPYSYNWTVNGIPYATSSTIIIDGSDYSPGNVNLSLTITDANGCLDNDTHVVLVTDCSSPCNCTPVLSLNEDDCTLTYYSNNCSGFTVYLQRLITGVWTDIATSPANPYTVTIDGSYRIKETSVSCGTFYSNVVTASCTECILSGTSSLGSQCGRINFEWDYNGENEVEITFAYPTTNTGDCNLAGGWVNFNPESASWSQSGQSGYLDVFEHCGKCIRIIFDDGECTPDDAYIVVPCCCEPEGIISETSDNLEYTQTIQGEYEIGVQPSMFYIREGTGQISQLVVEADIVPTDSEIHTLDIPMWSVHQLDLDCSPSTNRVDSIQFKRNGTTYKLNINPATTTFLTGPFGTATTAHLDLCNVSVTFNQKCISMKILLLNAISSVVSSITTNDILVGSYVNSFSSPEFEGEILVAIKPKWNSTTWIDDNVSWLLKMDSETSVSQNDAGRIINTVACSGTTTNSNPLTVNCDYETDCGTLEQDSPTFETYWSGTFCNIGWYFYPNFYSYSLQNLCLYQSCPLYSSVDIFDTTFEVWSIEDAGDGDNVTDSIECTTYTLTVDDECPSATYLWSNGATTESVTVLPGSYSVIITCPDECEFVLNYNVP